MDPMVAMMMEDHFDFCAREIRRIWALGPFDVVEHHDHWDIRLLGLV